MEQYVGLDVSQKETAICVVDGEGKRVWQGTCRSTPDVMAEIVRKRAPQAIKVAMETGPLAVWHWHELKAAGLSIVCIHARHAKAALSMQINKTDANDAFGLAQIVRTGWYRPVDMKSMESHKLRLLLVGRARLVSMRTALYSQIRGLLKTFGVVLTAGKGGSFERLVLQGLPKDHHVEVVIESLLST
jgi:transposase